MLTRGRSANERYAERKARSRRLSRRWSLGSAAGAPRSARRAVSQKPSYAVSPREPLVCFLDDGRAKIDGNVVGRPIRPIDETRRFAGSNGGARRWATVAFLIETAKLNGAEPHAYRANVVMTQSSTVICKPHRRAAATGLRARRAQGCGMKTTLTTSRRGLDG
ncbi:transposase [Hansschlegelia beijingensis]|uniref:IS66 family transposase n=1 Tax=Hansschlegelia beijingensis TaxID=1133344 RepID=UPI00387F1DAA